jgi:arsenate reductase
MLFVCYPRCTTCQKAKKWLEENNQKFEVRDIKLHNPTKEELAAWREKSNLPLQRFFNTSGQLYRIHAVKERLETMSDDEILSLLATDGMLVKRPILITENEVLVGFRQEEWHRHLMK